MSQYATLLSPVSIGPVQVRNRVVSSSHQTGLVHDNLPTDDLLAYHRARARGGVGAIFIEATAVHPTGLLTAHTIGGYYVIDAANLDDALEFAQRIPAVRLGGAVEVRPLVEVPVEYAH